MTWYLHIYHFLWLGLCLSFGFFISWWIPLIFIAAIVFYGMKY